MVVQHNLSALNTYRMLGMTSAKNAKSSEKLSSGYRINRAADDAAGLQISEKMRYQIRGLDQGARNTQDGISFVQVADGAMNEIQSMLQRLNELAVQAANGTNSESDRYAIDQEMQEIKNEIIRVGNTTKFNETPVFDNNSVQMYLTDKPTDLEIFNQTEANVGDKETFGGFVFHGERIPWKDIDSTMIAQDANGEYVFAKDQTYTVTTSDPNAPKYTFEFRTKAGDKVPLITREISIEADSSGITLDEELFTWDKVEDLYGNKVSDGNLHGGPWTVEYYGAKLSFTVPEPIINLDTFAADVNSKKSATVYYDWEGVYGENFTEEDALDSFKADVNASTDGNRVNQNSVDTMYDSTKGILYTVAADETGVWLKDSAGTDITPSKKTWKDFGIENWNDGFKIPDYKDGQEDITYVYHDMGRQGATELRFEFKLSDVTDREAVIESLNGMQLWQKPVPTTYVATVSGTASNQNVKDVDIKDDTLVLTFDEEYTAKREFNTKNWEMKELNAAYDDLDESFILTYNNNGSYKLTGKLDDIKTETVTAVKNYVNHVVSEHVKALIGNRAVTGTDVASYNAVLAPNRATERTITATLKSATGGDIKIDYTYDFAQELTDKNIDGLITSSFVLATGTLDNNTLQNGSGNGAISDYYVIHNNKYVDTQTLINNGTYTLAEIKSKDVYEIEIRFDGDTDRFEFEENMVKAIKEEVGKDIADATKIDLTAQSFSTMGSLNGENNESKIDRPYYEHELIETPVQPDLWIQHSSELDHRTGIPRYAMNTVVMGLALTNVRTQKDALDAIESVDYALKYVNEKRSHYGALQNRLEHTLNTVKNTSENTTAAESRIRDTDMAKEMVTLSINNILMQAGQSMLAQANQSTQGVLSLLQ